MTLSLAHFTGMMFSCTIMLNAVSHSPANSFRAESRTRLVLVAYQTPYPDKCEFSFLNSRFFSCYSSLQVVQSCCVLARYCINCHPLLVSQDALHLDAETEV